MAGRRSKAVLYKRSLAARSIKKLRAALRKGDCVGARMEHNYLRHENLFNHTRLATAHKLNKAIVACSVARRAR